MHLEAQMILNHKDAIEFLMSAADEIGFNRYTMIESFLLGRYFFAAGANASNST